MENLGMAFTLLLAGFVIVFVVLILLIVIITLYGKIIQAAQNASSNKKTKKQEKQTTDISVTEKPTVTVAVSENDTQDSDEIPGEIIAVIAAAVDAVYGNKPHKIKNVKRSRAMRSSWGNAGLAENTRPF